MGNKKILFLLLIAGILLILPGCIQFKTDKKGQAGGVHVSTNKGKAWNQMNTMLTPGANSQNISGVVVNDLVEDPSDPDALYLASQGSGLYYTFNVAKGWQKVKKLPGGKINAVAVNPKSKCVVYASVGNKVFKSTDCNRTWEPVYHDNDSQVSIDSIAIDHYEPSQVYIGTSRGDLLKTTDRGNSWKPIKRWDNNINGIHISPHDSRLMFVSIKDKPTFRSENGGKDWTSLKDNMEDFPNSHRVRDIDISEHTEGLMFMVTDYGLLKSTDYGDSCSKIELLTPEEQAKINAVDVNPQNPDEIYYVTQTTFYRSLNGGESWSTNSLPTSRHGADLLINPEKPNIIYLGAGINPNNQGGGPL